MEQTRDELIQHLIEWAWSRWEAEVKNRPPHNIHYRALDTTWKQVIRKLGSLS